MLFGCWKCNCSHIPESSVDLLRDLQVLILDAVRRKPHPTHLSLEQALDWSRRIGAHQTYFTHIAHDLLHAQISRELPPGVDLAYDGQVLDL